MTKKLSRNNGNAKTLFGHSAVLSLPAVPLRKVSKETTAAASTATSTPQINDLIGWMRKKNRAARAARPLVQICDVVCHVRM